MAANIEVIVGTYEEFLLGYKVEESAKKSESYSLNQSFAVHAHTASVRTVDTKGKYLASGGADDRIYVYDMKSRQEIQTLTPHSGIVNHIQFTPDQTHLFSASADGSFAATRTGSWISEGFWKAPHGGKPITFISIHPSGKLALTLGADLTLKTWNLIKGRQIFTTNLKSKPTLGRIVDCVEWNPTGQFFTLTGAKTIEIWDIDTAGVVKEVPCDSRPTCVCWVDDATQIVGLNNGKILMFSLDDDEPTVFQMYESSRVKGLCFHDGYLASISSSGDVTVWTVNIEERDITEICTTNIGCRPICVTILDLSKFAKDYVLKMESVDEQEENEISVNEEERPRKKSKPNAPTGKVTVEIENEENGIQLPQKSTNSKADSKDKKTANKRISLNVTASNNGLNDSVAKKKNKKNSANTSAFVEEDAAKSSKNTKVANGNKRKSVSNFVEEDISVETSKKVINSTGKGKSKLNKTVSDFSEVAAKSPSTKKSHKKSRLSLA